MKLTPIPAAALALVLSAGAVAHPKMSDDEMPRHIDRMAEQLELTDAQRTQVAELMKAHHERTQAARDEMKRSREQLHEALMKVLTPEQAAQLDAMHERRDERHGKHKDKDKKDGHGEHRH